jgi:hypothetical protein
MFRIKLLALKPREKLSAVNLISRLNYGKEHIPVSKNGKITNECIRQPSVLMKSRKILSFSVALKFKTRRNL